jgi:hypothetical protein
MWRDRSLIRADFTTYAVLIKLIFSNSLNFHRPDRPHAPHFGNRAVWPGISKIGLYTADDFHLAGAKGFTAGTFPSASFLMKPIAWS